MIQNNILEIRNLQKAFGKFVALDHINFSIEYGRIVGLLGKNGAGKTTLIKTILGLYRNYSGDIYYDGAIIDHSDCRVMNSIGSLVDTAFYEDFSAYDNLKILMMSTPAWKGRESRKKIMELLEFVGLEKNEKDKVKSFSFGMKQRLALAQALLVEPKLLILDEPFVGLDPLGIELVKEKLHVLCNENKVSIIFSSHQLAEVSELSEDLIMIEGGRVSYAGSYDDLMNQDKCYSIYLDKDISQEAKRYLEDISLDIFSELNIVKLPYREKKLDDCLKILMGMEYRVTDVSVEEASLIKFFKE